MFRSSTMMIVTIMFWIECYPLILIPLKMLKQVFLQMDWKLGFIRNRHRISLEGLIACTYLYYTRHYNQEWRFVIIWIKIFLLIVLNPWTTNDDNCRSEKRVHFNGLCFWWLFKMRLSFLQNKPSLNFWIQVLSSTDALFEL